ncbi:MAG: hypothetical protein QOF30_460 [Acidimicrobiaceae bacterium]|jgi:hypothetical protein|nr:hypothetical protein [Acidimicrobiaceae bacterium]
MSTVNLDAESASEDPGRQRGGAPTSSGKVVTPGESGVTRHMNFIKREGCAEGERSR